MISVCKCLLIEQTFTKWTSSLSLILDSHCFNYLLDDPVHLPVNFASTQTSSIPDYEHLPWGTGDKYDRGMQAVMGFPLQLLFGPLFLCPNMFKENPVCRKAHRIIKYLKLKRMNPSIKLRELVKDRVKFRNKALLKETLIINDLEQD